MFKKHNADAPKVHRAKSWQSDVLGILIFVVVVAAGVFIINLAVFRSYSVVGPSMEPTLYTNDRLIVNRLPVTWAALEGKDYVPERGQIIVFKNPSYKPGMEDEYIVKRVIGFPGERIVVNNCVLKVYNADHPKGFNPYNDFDVDASTCVSGSVDTTVEQGKIFVVGDHRNGSYSLDSRSGLGQIPFGDIIGPVSIELFPLDKFRFF
jgi:signal peptidase I